MYFTLKALVIFALFIAEGAYPSNKRLDLKVETGYEKRCIFLDPAAVAEKIEQVAALLRDLLGSPEKLSYFEPYVAEAIREIDYNAQFNEASKSLGIADEAVDSIKSSAKYCLTGLRNYLQTKINVACLIIKDFLNPAFFDAKKLEYYELKELVQLYSGASGDIKDIINGNSFDAEHSPKPFVQRIRAYSDEDLVAAHALVTHARHRLPWRQLLFENAKKELHYLILATGKESSESFRKDPHWPGLSPRQWRMVEKHLLFDCTPLCYDANALENLTSAAQDAREADHVVKVLFRDFFEQHILLDLVIIPELLWRGEVFSAQQDDDYDNEESDPLVALRELGAAFERKGGKRNSFS